MKSIGSSQGTPRTTLSRETGNVRDALDQQIERNEGCWVCQPSRAIESEGWRGRRDSNPRPPA